MGKIRIQDEHPGSAALTNTEQDSLFCFKDPIRWFWEFPCTQVLNNAAFGWNLVSPDPAAGPLPHFCRTGGFVSYSVADPGCFSRILIFILSRSWIPDPGSNNTNKRGGGGICCLQCCGFLGTDPYLWLMDSDPDSDPVPDPAIFVRDLKMAIKNYVFPSFTYFFLKLLLDHFFKDKKS
jgi:hypothetical protein